MRPDPEGLVNSVSAMPTLRRTHSTWSALPVATAMCGMSPSDLFLGIRASKVVLVHEAVPGTVSWRRQRPAWMTTGMLLPTGTLIRGKVPSGAVMAHTRGEPDGGWPGTGQETPAVKGLTGALGM